MMTLEMYIVLIVVPLVLGIWAQVKVSSKYGKWSRVPSRGKITGAEAATAVMRNAGVENVSIVSIHGTLTDHYDPMRRQLALSESNFHGTSLAALGVAAHEAGHAIQHKQGYKPLQLRSVLVPVTAIASQLLPFVIFGGFVFNIFGLIRYAVWIYAILAVFQIVTLPVEFDASRRAKLALSRLGIVERDEECGVAETLDAAAWTYVAALIATLGNLAYCILIRRERD
jgi:Zn-dependent membrane protease YugP